MTALDFLPPNVTHTVYPDRAAWLSARTDDMGRGFIGSTTPAAILGWSEYASPWDVWARAHAPDLVHSDMTSGDDSVLNRGLVMEPALWTEYRRKFLSEVMEPGHVRVYNGRYCVSPDAFIYDDDLGWGVGEGKTVMLRHSQWVPRLDGDTFYIDGLKGLSEWPMPRAYLAQALTMCIGTGLRFCDLFAAVVIEVEDPKCAIATEEFPDVQPHAIVRSARIRLVPDAADLAMFNRLVGGWVQRHLIGGEPPPIDDSKTAWLHSLGEDPATRVDKCEATDVQAVMIQDYLEGRDVRNDGEKTRKTRAAELVATMRDANLRSVFVTRDDGKRITATISKNGRLTITEPKT